MRSTSAIGAVITLIRLRISWRRTLFLFGASKPSMTPPLPSRRRSKTPPPGETGQEALYLRSLSDRQVPVAIKLRDGETVRGWIEYFDDGMLRLTRDGQPNLFIYKHQIRTITESGKRRTTVGSLVNAVSAPRGGGL